MTAKEYLERIENKKLSKGNYSLSELISFAEKYADQLHIHGVSKSSCEHSDIAWEGNPLKIICQNCGREVDKKDVC